MLSTDSTRFNSIKVRLRLLRGLGYSVDPKFQFHKGTIKTSVDKVHDEFLPWFQFHKGTIKTGDCNYFFLLY